ncbi:hypothetical protein H4W33_005086 [Kibdelosporangium phytohabitans]|nr:hypothetical protein [Kibdelosporangium phytohabitans]
MAGNRTGESSRYLHCQAHARREDGLRSFTWRVMCQKWAVRWMDRIAPPAG